MNHKMFIKPRMSTSVKYQFCTQALKKKKNKSERISSHSLTSCLIKTNHDIYLQMNEIHFYLQISFELTLPQPLIIKGTLTLYTRSS